MEIDKSLGPGLKEMLRNPYLAEFFVYKVSNFKHPCKGYKTIQ
jgi:hypothetical protein